MVYLTVVNGKTRIGTKIVNGEVVSIVLRGYTPLRTETALKSADAHTLILPGNVFSIHFPTLYNPN